MLPTLTPDLLFNCEYLSLDLIWNKDTLNLFSDASMARIKKKDPDNLMSCYGSVAVCENRIINEMYRQNSLTTVSAAELRGVRCSLYLALRYKKYFRIFNIFSDSLYSIQSIRDYKMDWEWNEKTELYRYNKLHPSHTRPIANQTLIYEILLLINELKQYGKINIFHQRGHIQKPEEVVEALESFRLHNGFRGQVSKDVIKYISYYNNYMDEWTRIRVHNMRVKNEFYDDPVIFKPRPDIFVN